MPTGTDHNRRPLVLGIVAAVVALLAAAASIWAKHADALLGTGALFTASAPWLTAALGAAVAVLGVAVCARLARRSRAVARQLREGEARLDAIVRSAMDAIITVDATSASCCSTPRPSRCSGAARRRRVGGPLDRFLPERFRAVARAARRAVRPHRRDVAPMGTQAALCGAARRRHRVPDRSRRSRRRRRRPAAAHRDPARHQRARASRARRSGARTSELRELALAMHEVREAERTRIARELHDELGQALTALKMDVELLGSTLPERRYRSARADRGDARAARCHGRDDAPHLGGPAPARARRPRPRRSGGMARAELRPAHADPPATCEVDPSCAQLGEPLRVGPLPHHAGVAHQRRPARAARAGSRCGSSASGDDAVLTVRDDGIGMDRTARPKPRSFGLRGISERVLLLGGEREDHEPTGRGHDASSRGSRSPARTRRRRPRDDPGADRRRPRHRARGPAAHPRRATRRSRSSARRRTATRCSRAVRAGGFDVLLLDLSMPGRSGIELIRQVKAERPELRVLVLSMHAEEQYAVRAIRAGASGYLTKDTASTQLVAALRKIAAGGALHHAGRRRGARARAAIARREELPHKRLSDREYEVFLLLAGGAVGHRDRRAAKPEREDREHAQDPHPREAGPRLARGAGPLRRHPPAARLARPPAVARRDRRFRPPRTIPRRRRGVSPSAVSAAADGGAAPARTHLRRESGNGQRDERIRGRGCSGSQETPRRDTPHRRGRRRRRRGRVGAHRRRRRARRPPST